jgi:TonB family protein
MHPSLRAALAAACILSIAPSANAQTPPAVPSAAGREFWLVFQRNFRDFVINERTQAAMPAAPLELGLFIASESGSSGYVEIPGLGFRSEFSVKPGRVHYVALDSAAQLRASGVVEKLGVHVVAEQPVTVYGLSRRYQTTDTYLAIPTNALGTSYRTVGYKWLQNDLLSQMAVVATEDNTVVTIHPSVHVQQFVAPAMPVSAAEQPRQDSRREEREIEPRLRTVVVDTYDAQQVTALPTFSYDELRRTIIVPSMRSRTVAETRGIVVVDAKVFYDGTVGEVKVVRSDRPEHDRFVVDAVRKLTYTPATNDGEKVSAWVRIPVDVTIDNFGGEPRDRSTVKKLIEPQKDGGIRSYVTAHHGPYVIASSYLDQKIDQEPTFSYAQLERALKMPPSWKKQASEGEEPMAVDVFVSKTGKVERVQEVTIEDRTKPIAKSVLAAVRSLKFTPGVYHGENVAGWTRIVVDVRPGNFGGDPQSGMVVDHRPMLGLGVGPRTERLETMELSDKEPVAEDSPVEMEVAIRPRGSIMDSSRVYGLPTETRMLPVGSPITVTLNRGDAYQLIPKYDPSGTSDLTGSLVTSSKPVAVFSGHNCAYVPDATVKACNLLAEQMPPTSTWGTSFVVGRLAARSSSVMRVVAREDSTLVTVNGKHVATLRAGEFHHAEVLENTIVFTSRPALVAQYAKGFDNGDNVGDPMMIVLPSIEQFDNVYTIATPMRGTWHHYVNVIVKTDEIESLRFDTHPVDQTRFKPLGESGYSVGQLEISYGTHVVAGAKPFGLYQYGFGYDEAAYDAYGNGGGQLYIDRDKLEDGAAPGEELPDIGLLTR